MMTLVEWAKQSGITVEEFGFQLVSAMGALAEMAISEANDPNANAVAFETGSDRHDYRITVVRSPKKTAKTLTLVPSRKSLH